MQDLLVSIVSKGIDAIVAVFVAFFDFLFAHPVLLIPLIGWYVYDTFVAPVLKERRRQQELTAANAQAVRAAAERDAALAELERLKSKQ